jgi:hypothetical protein
MLGMVWNVSARVCVGSSPATNVSEQSVWAIRPVATRAVLPGRKTTTALYPRAVVPFCNRSS